VIPDLRRLALLCSFLTSFTSRHVILSQEHKFLCRMLKISATYWTTMIRISWSNNWLKLGRKHPWRSRHTERTSTWAHEATADCFRIDCLTLTSRCLRLLREWRANSNNWARKYVDVCVLWGDSKGLEEAFVSSGFKDWFIHVIFKVSCLVTCINKHRWWSG